MTPDTAGCARQFLERAAGQGADRVERDVPEQLDPDLLPEPGRDRTPEPRRDQGVGDLLGPLRLRPVRLAEAEPLPFGVVDHAGLDDVGGEVGKGTNHAPRFDRRGDDAARVNALEPQAVELPAGALEIPPRHAVLCAHDDRVRPEQGAEIGCERRQAVRLHAEEHDVGGADRLPGRRTTCGFTSKSPSALRTCRPRSCIARRCGPRANRTTSAPDCVRRAPMYPPMAPAPAMTILTSASRRTPRPRRGAGFCRWPCGEWCR